jgi:hypothetical protein
MNRKMVRTITLGTFALVAVLCAARLGRATDDKMASLDQYLMADRNAEIALARSAAPPSISGDATVMVLGQHGYETAVTGKNGFVCIVDRAWTQPFDAPEFWNPKNRSPICYNPVAARSSLPHIFKRTELALAGLSNPQMLERMKAAVANKELPTPEPGAMSYMMSKESHLNDQAGHWVPHLMFHIPKTDGASWGANLDHSPVLMDTRSIPEPETIFYVPLDKWSDGTPADAH